MKLAYLLIPVWLGTCLWLESAAAAVNLLPKIDQRMAYGDNSGGQSTTTALQLDSEFRPRNFWKITAITEWTYDGIDRLEPGRIRDSNRSGASRRLALGTQSSLELKELYADTNLRKWRIRLGKQQIVWGTSDGIKILDIANPQSFREGVLEQAELARTPLWAAKAVRSIGQRSTVEWILIPDLSFHDIPDKGALFEITSPRLAPTPPQGNNIPVAISNRRPSLKAEHLEYGLRLASAYGRWEFGLLGFRHFNDTPSQSLSITPSGARIQRRYQQTYTVGAHANRPLGSLLIRTELAYTHAAPLPALQLPDETRRLSAPLIAGVIGADMAVRDSGLVSLQYAQRHAQTDARHPQLPHQQRYITALWRDEWSRRGLELELFTTYALEDRDAMVRLRLNKRVNPMLTLSFGGDIFDGARRGVFGQHRHLDRILFGFSIYL